MLFGEPQRTQGDIHFRLFGFPVRVHPFFWLIVFLFGLSGGPPLPLVLVWVVAVFISILSHELGHALVMRHYGISPRITLYGMGGLASYEPSLVRDQRAFDTVAQIAISFAGPLAGFLLAAVIVVAIVASGNSFEITFIAPFGPLINPVGITNEILFYFLSNILFVSVTWGLFNLFPVYPLDGGNISREIFMRFGARNGIRRSLTLSMVVASSVAVLSLAYAVRSSGIYAFGCSANLFVPLLFGVLAFNSHKALQAYEGRG